MHEVKTEPAGHGQRGDTFVYKPCTAFWEPTESQTPAQTRSKQAEVRQEPQKTVSQAAKGVLTASGLPYDLVGKGWGEDGAELRRVFLSVGLFGCEGQRGRRGLNTQSRLKGTAPEDLRGRTMALLRATRHLPTVTVELFSTSWRLQDLLDGQHEMAVKYLKKEYVHEVKSHIVAKRYRLHEGVLADEVTILGGTTGQVC